MRWYILLRAMCCHRRCCWRYRAGVALVACDTPVNRELAGEAAAWAEATRPEEELAGAMMLLYKNEDRKQELVQKAKEQAAHASVLPGC